MKIFKPLFFERQFLFERILALVSALSNLGRLYFVNQYDFQFKLFQYLLIPFLVAFFALPKLSIKKQALRNAITVGTLSGIPSAFAEIIILLYQYYFLDYRSIIAAQQGRLPEPITITTVMLTIEGGVVVGFFSLLLSAISGLIAGLFAHKFIPK